MELNDKVTQLEDEIKILKNEVQAVLLDLRDSYLNRENPFSPAASPMVNQPIIINQPPPAASEEPDDVAPGEDQESELPGAEESANELESVSEPGLNDEPDSAGELELNNEPEPAGEAEPVYKQEVIASEETAHEEVKRAWRPEIEPGALFKARATTDDTTGKIDLDTMAGLAQWVDEAVKQFGSERTEVILDIFELMGHLLPELKNILVKFISSVPAESSGKVTTQDYLASIIKLGNLLGKDNKSEVALLYILCQENGHR